MYGAVSAYIAKRWDTKRLEMRRLGVHGVSAFEKALRTLKG